MIEGYQYLPGSKRWVKLPSPAWGEGRDFFLKELTKVLQAYRSKGGRVITSTPTRVENQRY